MAVSFVSRHYLYKTSLGGISAASLHPEAPWMWLVCLFALRLRFRDGLPSLCLSQRHFSISISIKNSSNPEKGGQPYIVTIYYHYHQCLR